MSLRPGQRYPQISLMIDTETAKWGCRRYAPHYAYKVRQYWVAVPECHLSLAEVPAAVNADDTSSLRPTMILACPDSTSTLIHHSQVLQLYR